MPKIKKRKISKIKGIKRFLLQKEKENLGTSDKERLIWLLQTILKEQESFPGTGNMFMVRLDKIVVAPHFDGIDTAQDFYTLLEPVIADKDFFKKNNMENYKPTYNVDYSHDYSDYDIATFSDFTNDFVKKYLKERLGVKSAATSNGNSIEKIEILKDEKEQGRIKVYINGDYEKEPLDFSRNNRWGKMYELAKTHKIPFDKSFYDYFNYQQTNPLYTKEFEVTKILKEKDSFIVPNIEIKLITKSKMTRQLKSA